MCFFFLLTTEDVIMRVGTGTVGPSRLVVGSGTVVSTRLVVGSGTVVSARLVVMPKYQCASRDIIFIYAICVR